MSYYRAGVSRTCLFAVNGLGMGNSTRCHAVIEHLAAAGCEIHVLTSGNGLSYFRDKTCVQSLTAMEPLFYSGNKSGISGWSTLKALGTLKKIADRKRETLAHLLEQVSPNVVIIDSEYTLKPIRKLGVPVVGLNTSEMVVSGYLKARRKPRGIKSHFWFIEFSDYLFHRAFCNLVLSPFPLRTPTRHPKFKRIGLIVRSGLKSQVLEQGKPETRLPRELRRVVFMLSGSVHASNIPYEKHQFPFHIDVVGRPGKSTDKITFHGRKMDNTDLLVQADALVINGGYSAVSEAFLLRKPVFVIPVPGHAEQFVNAELVRSLGLGFVATEDSLLDQLAAVYKRNTWEGIDPAAREFETTGAEEAAEAILQLISGVPVPDLVGQGSSHPGHNLPAESAIERGLV